MPQLNQEITDEQLMLAVKAGQLQQSAILFERYHRRLFAFFAHNLADREAAHDLTQQLFLRLLKYRGSYKADSPVQAWLFKIARNLLTDHYRRNRLRVSSYTTPEALSDTLAEVPDDEAHQQEQLLQQALACLAPPERELLVMSRYQQMKYEQIAEATGLTVANIKVKVHRSIQKLRKHYFALAKAQD